MENKDYMQKLDEIKNQGERIKKTLPCNSGKHPLGRRLLIVIVSLILLICLSFAAVASFSGGVNKATDFVARSVRFILQIKPDTEVDIDGMTVIKGSGTRKYTSFDAFYKAEKVDIYYPSVLPEEGMKLESILVMSFDNGERYDIAFAYSPKMLNFEAENRLLNDENVLAENCEETREVNGLRFYIMKKENGKVYAVAIDNGMQYSIATSDYEAMHSVLDGLKRLSERE